MKCLIDSCCRFFSELIDFAQLFAMDVPCIVFLVFQKRVFSIHLVSGLPPDCILIWRIGIESVDRLSLRTFFTSLILNFSSLYLILFD